MYLILYCHLVVLYHSLSFLFTRYLENGVFGIGMKRTDRHGRRPVHANFASLGGLEQF